MLQRVCLPTFKVSVFIKWERQTQPRDTTNAKYCRKSGPFLQKLFFILQKLWYQYLFICEVRKKGQKKKWLFVRDGARGLSRVYHSFVGERERWFSFSVVQSLNSPLGLNRDGDDGRRDSLGVQNVLFDAVLPHNLRYWCHITFWDQSILHVNNWEFRAVKSSAGC